MVYKIGALLRQLHPLGHLNRLKSVAVNCFLEWVSIAFMLFQKLKFFYDLTLFYRGDLLRFLW